MEFPDPLDKPARTVITSEGGSTVSRTKHVVRDPDGHLRRLTTPTRDFTCCAVREQRLMAPRRR
jgi:hypothetical protein